MKAIARGAGVQVSQKQVREEVPQPLVIVAAAGNAAPCMLAVTELSKVSPPKCSPWFRVRLDPTWSFDKVSSGACEHLSQKRF